MRFKTFLKSSDCHLCLYDDVSYVAHQDRVTCVQFSPVHEFVLSCSRDKYFEWHCAQSGRRLGGYLASAWTTCLQYLFGWSFCLIKMIKHFLILFQKNCVLSDF